MDAFILLLSFVFVQFRYYVSLGLEVFTSTCEAQSSVQERGRPIHSVPPAHSSSLCSVAFSAHTNKEEDNWSPPSLARKQPSLNPVPGEGWMGTGLSKGSCVQLGSALRKAESTGTARVL